jgi:glc operon protein GlcG
MAAIAAGAFTAVHLKEKTPMSPIRVLAVAVLAEALLVANPILAQSPPTPNPLDAVPEKMPFDVPYGAPISLERAQAAIAGAVAEARKRDWKMNVAVVDSGGNLVAFQRMDGAQLASIQISEHKARAAAIYRRETVIFENGIQRLDFKYLMTLDGVIGSRGGIPLVEGGKLIGAIGCSGGTGSQDEVSCKAGAALIK